VEQCLARLIPDFTASGLREQIDSLWSNEHGWDKATTELLGLDYLHRCNTLDTIGWPKGRSSTPPFDARISLPSTISRKHHILIDFKSASAFRSGRNLVYERVLKAANNWAAERGLCKPGVEVEWQGNSTARSVGNQLRKIEESFVLEIAKCTHFPSNTIKIKIRGCSFEITVKPHTGRECHGGVSGVDAMASSIKEQILEDVTGKNPHAQKENSGFILFYVRPDFQGGADLTEHVLFRAAEIADKEMISDGKIGTDEWLGVAFLDWTGIFKAVSYFRDRVEWPRGLSPLVVRRALRITEWLRRVD